MRQLKHHEKKLLRKVDLFSWKKEDNLRVAQILRRYHVQDKNDYVAYNRICGMIGKLSAKLKVCFFDFRMRRGTGMALLGKRTSSLCQSFIFCSVSYLILSLIFSFDQ